MRQHYPSSKESEKKLDLRNKVAAAVLSSTEYKRLFGEQELRSHTSVRSLQHISRCQTENVSFQEVARYHTN